MIELQPVVDRITAKTGYACELATEMEEFKIPLEDLPKVFVGLLAIDPTQEVSAFNEGSMEGTSAYGEELMVSISIRLQTTVELLPSHTKAIYNAIAGWSPNDPLDMSGFVLLKAATLNINNSRADWLFQFGLTIPTLGATIV